MITRNALAASRPLWTRGAAAIANSISGPSRITHNPVSSAFCVPRLGHDRSVLASVPAQRETIRISHRRRLSTSQHRQKSTPDPTSPSPNAVKPPSQPSPSTPLSSPSPSSDSSTVTEVSTDAISVEKKKPPDLPQDTTNSASVRRLLAMAWPQWRLMSVGFVALGGSVAAGTSFPYFAGRIVDHFNPTTPADHLLFDLTVPQSAGLMAAVLLAGCTAGGIRSICLRLSGQRTVALIRFADRLE